LGEANLACSVLINIRASYMRVHSLSKLGISVLR